MPTTQMQNGLHGRDRASAERLEDEFRNLWELADDRLQAPHRVRRGFKLFKTGKGAGQERGRLIVAPDCTDRACGHALDRVAKCQCHCPTRRGGSGWSSAGQCLEALAKC